MKATNQYFQKHTNLALILREIWKNPGITRVQIAQNLDLDKSTVVNIVNREIKRGIVTPIEKAESTPLGGRKPMMYKINQNFGSILGIEVQNDFYNAILTNLNGDVLYSKSEPCDVAGEKFEGSLLEIVDLIMEEIENIKIPLIGMCIGLPGVVNTNEGRVLYSIPLDLSGYNFAERISRKFDIPLLIENDANCCAWGELFERKNSGNFIYILSEYHDENIAADLPKTIGIGMGIVINEEIYYGNNYSSGEFKSVLWNGPVQSQFGISDEKLQDIKDDESLQKRIIEELILTVNALISTLNPEFVIIGGFLKDKMHFIRKHLLENYSKLYSTNLVYNKCRVAPSILEEHPAAFGAAAMFLQKLFAIPQLMTNQPYYSLNWTDIIKRVRGGEFED